MGVLSVDGPHQVSDIFFVFKEEADKRDKNKDSLVFLVGWFESILNLYNKQLICEPVKRIRGKVRDEIPEEIKEAYNKNKFVYDRSYAIMSILQEI